MTNIFVMTHKNFKMPTDLSCYKPIHVGREGKQDLGYIGDNTGDNISIKNCYYGELTGLYWVWKNYPGDDNVGICHYRRFFTDNNGYVLSPEKCDEILKESDIITSKSLDTDGDNYREHYAKSHKVEDLDKVGEIIKELYPEDYDFFVKGINSNKNYFGNLMITSRKHFNDYCEWLFGIFFKMEEDMDYSKYEDDYHRRVYGFLSEQLLKIWVEARGLKVYECNVAMTDEKAETKEFKAAIGQLVKMNQISEARQFFYEILKVRPDIRLAASDLKNEIFIIEQILYIIEEEQKAGTDGVYSFSKELPGLIEHFRKLCLIVNAECLEKEDILYIKDNRVSKIAIQVIIANNPHNEKNVEDIFSLLDNKNNGELKKICFVFVVGKLETLDYFAYELMRACDKFGIAYYIIDENKVDTYTGTELKDFVNNSRVCAFMFNQIGIRLLEGNKSFWDKYNIPVIDFIVDHPYNYDEDLTNPNTDNFNLIVLDRNHDKYIRKYFSKFNNIFFMPNGGNEVAGKMKYIDRPIDILYVGNCNLDNPLPEVAVFEDKGAQMYSVVYNIIVQNSFLTVEQAMELYFDTIPELSFDTRKKLIINYGFIIADMVRRYFKLKTMHALESLGANIVIYGANWDTNGEKWSENVHIYNRISSDECNQMLGKTKIGLNCMPWYKDGCSERVFNVMLNGAVCLTDTSKYLMERFEHGKELVFYNLDNMDEMKENVKWLLDNPKEASLIAERGYKIASNNDTWEERMKTIYGFAETLLNDKKIEE